MQIYIGQSSKFKDIFDWFPLHNVRSQKWKWKAKGFAQIL